MRLPYVWIGVCTFLSIAGCHSGTGNGTPSTGPSTPSSTAPTVDARFVDVTQAAGINYQWVIAGKSPHTILQTIGNGCAFLDFDNDGNLDILLVGPKLALYKGDGHGHFADVTHQAGLDKLHGSFLGCAVGDYDNDGYDDIYLTAYHGGALLHNDQGKALTDVTSQAHIGPQPWGSSAAFVDIDNDGKLDLYIGNYVDFGPNTDPQLCTSGGMKTSCGPRFYKAIKGCLYRNLGGGIFSDVTRAWSADTVSGKSLGVAFADFDGSGHQSIEIANDEVTGNLLKNNGHKFENIAASAGTAVASSGEPVGGMGVDWGDFDNDGRLDLAVATFQHEAKQIYHNDGGDVFTEQSAALGIAELTAPNVAFGAKWLDFDNDGWLDLIFSNGHVQDNIGDIDKSTSFQQPTQLFHNEKGQKLTDAGAALVGPAGRPIVGRGVAIGDYDNDGKIDALVVDSGGAPVLLHNETPQVGHWLKIKLVGRKSNRDGQGALITVEAGGTKLLRQCTTSGSYMSASDRQVHVGLGPATVADTVTVRWPNGGVDTYQHVDADKIVTLTEGDPTVK